MVFLQQLERIVTKFELLRTLDSNLDIHGSEEHQYKLNPSISENIVTTLEEKHSIKLPSDYRYFICFIDWYETWLNRSLAMLEKNHR